MQKKTKQYLLLFGLLGVILVIDQALKIWVKTHMVIGEEIPLIGDWCLLHFVENQGFAFGTTIGGTTGKIILSLFRFVASAVLVWYMVGYVKRDGRTSVVAYGSLIAAGAIGNLIDCSFYGVLFNESTYTVAQMFPPEGYAPLLQGSVVDMFFLPIIETDLPAGFPIWGGEHFVFFNAIFNVADAAITVGAFWFIIDQVIQNLADRKKKRIADLQEAENGEKNEA